MQELAKCMDELNGLRDAKEKEIKEVRKQAEKDKVLLIQHYEKEKKREYHSCASHGFSFT